MPTNPSTTKADTRGAVYVTLIGCYLSRCLWGKPSFFLLLSLYKLENGVSKVLEHANYLSMSSDDVAQVNFLKIQSEKLNQLLAKGSSFVQPTLWSLLF